MSPSRRILAVDDEPDILTIYTVNLELAGHDIVTARDGVEALAALHTTPLPDVILLDIMMPRLDGWAVLRRIVEDDTIDHVPVIMVSAKVTAPDRQRASDMGATAFLAKPFTTASLLGVIERTAGLSMASVP